MADFFASTYPAPTNPVRNTPDEKGARLRTTPLDSNVQTAVIGVGDRILLGKVPSNARLVDLGQISYGAFGAGAAFNLGFDHPKMSAAERAANVAKLWAAQAVAAAGSRKVMFATPLADLSKRVWQMAGLAADPGGEMDIVANPSTATSAIALIHGEVTFTTD